MQCLHCESTSIVRNGKLKDGRQRYKCNDCGKQFCETTGNFFHKHRVPKEILRVIIFSHLFIPAQIVKILNYFQFRCLVSEDTICFWSRKFLDSLPDVQIKSEARKALKVRHTDEKFIYILNQLTYWVNTVDSDGKAMTSSIQIKKDLPAIKSHMKKHKALEKDIDIMVTDKMPSYPKAVGSFGRKCRHVTAGLQEKAVYTKKNTLFLSNLPVERLHSKIDAFIELKVRGNFSSLEQAERTRKAFMLTQLIKEELALRHRFGITSTAPDGHAILAELNGLGHNLS